MNKPGKTILEIAFYAGVILAFWVFVLGGSLPSWNRTPAAAPAPAPVVEQPIASAAPETPAASSIPVASLAPAPSIPASAPNTGLVTVLLGIVVVGLIVLLLGVVAFMVFVWRMKVRAERLQAQAAGEVQPATARWWQRLPRFRGPLLPAPTTVDAQFTPVATGPAIPVAQPWLGMAMAEVLDMSRRFGWDEAPLSLIEFSKREQRIRYLQAVLGVDEVRVAPDFSLAVFRFIHMSLSEVQQLAAPQPAVLDLDRGCPVAIVYLAQPELALAGVQAEARSAAAPAAQPAAALAHIPELKPIQDVPIGQRGHTAAAASTRSGKTATLNTLLVEDLARGAQAVVCSTHFTYYHPIDQPIDLRPLAPYFEAVWEIKQIEQVLTRACSIIDERMEIYRNAGDVGHDIIIYLGEWGSIYDALKDRVITLLQKILDQGTKAHVYIGFIEYHTALVGRNGGDSALREAFTTRLVAGNVDTTTWRAFVGDAWERQHIPRGQWMTESGRTPVIRPTAQRVNEVALQMELATRLEQREWDLLVSEVSSGETKLQPGNGGVAASQSAVSKVAQVAEVTVTPAEVAEIALKLGQNMKPSVIAKSLPGYDSRDYKTWAEKVRIVQGMLKGADGSDKTEDLPANVSPIGDTTQRTVKALAS